jgi:hypothetical protein
LLNIQILIFYFVLAASASSSSQPGQFSSLYHSANGQHPLVGGPPYTNMGMNAIMWPFRAKQRRGVLRRAVFSDSQRKGLEAAFVKQKYISKPDRKKLASKLSLKDSQVRYEEKNEKFFF